MYTNGNKDDSDYKEKWQTYDGLLDIKGLSQYMTVSNCKFKNHDKASLIGNDDSEGNDADKRLITYHHNYFYNCGQRLPMMRNGTFHLYNNYYAYSNGSYEQGYAMGVRAGSTVYAENNYFAKGIYAAFSADTDSVGTLYSKDNAIEAGVNEFNKGASSSGETKFSELTNPAYEYDITTIPVANVPTNAGTATATIKDKSETIIVDGGGTTGEGITAIAFSATGKTIVAGDTLDLTKLVTLTPSTADVSGLTWTVESGTSATVTDGVVTASSMAGDTVVKVASTADATVSATFTVTVVEASAQVYNFLALTDADYDSSTSAVTSVASTDSTKTLTCTNVVFQNSSYGIKYNSGSIVIPVTGADTTIIAYVTYESGTNVTLSDGADYSVTRTIQNRGTRVDNGVDFKDNAGPQAYVWRYTGGASSVTLTAVGQVYVGKLFVDNDAVSDTQTTSKFDFTVANSDGMNDIPTVSTGSSRKIYFFSSGTETDYQHATASPYAPRRKTPRSQAREVPLRFILLQIQEHIICLRWTERNWQRER